VKTTYIFVTRNTYVCIEHFVDECFEQVRICPCVKQVIHAEHNLQRPRILRPDAIGRKSGVSKMVSQIFLKIIVVLSIGFLVMVKKNVSSLSIC